MDCIPLAPFSPFVALPPAVTVATAAVAALVAAPALVAPRVHAGTVRAPEVTTIVAVVLAVVSGLALLAAGLGAGGGKSLRARLAARPWRAAQVEGKGGDAVCPYTGGRPTRRCPACGACVAAAAWHGGDRLANALIGGAPLLWDEAAAALDDHDGDAAATRVKLDTALSVRGNFLTASLSPCCTGCKAALTATNLHPRLACVLAALACAAALVPWGFGASLRQLDAALPGAGGRVQAAALALAVWLAAACVATAAHAVAAAGVGAARACVADGAAAPRWAAAWPVRVVAGATKWSGWKQS